MSSVKSTRRIVWFVLGLVVGLAVAELWRPLSAEAQIPDAGRQLLDLQQSTGESNRLLSEILSVLQKGTLKVRIAEPEKTTKPPQVR